MRNLFLSLALLAALPVAASETALTAGQFEAMVTGKTLSYSSGGLEYGAEEYFPNRRVRWSFLDGECQDGEWYTSGEDICFIYDEMPVPQCWRFFERGGRIVARFQDDAPGRELYETQSSEEPLLCLGPKIGV